MDPATTSNCIVLSAEDAFKVSTENGWETSFNDPGCSYSLGDVIKLLDGNILRGGYNKGRVVKETKCFVWIACHCNITPQKKAKKYVQRLAATPALMSKEELDCDVPTSGEDEKSQGKIVPSGKDFVFDENKCNQDVVTTNEEQKQSDNSINLAVSDCH